LDFYAREKDWLDAKEDGGVEHSEALALSSMLVRGNLPRRRDCG